MDNTIYIKIEPDSFLDEGHENEGFNETKQKIETESKDLADINETEIEKIKTEPEEPVDYSYSYSYVNGKESVTIKSEPEVLVEDWFPNEDENQTKTESEDVSDEYPNKDVFYPISNNTASDDSIPDNTSPSETLGSGFSKRPKAGVYLKQKPHQCNQCSYACAKPSILKNHIIAIHLKEKPYQCTHCSYSCTQSGALKRHIVAIHLKEKPYQCSRCSYSCTQSGALNEHIKAVHLKERPHKCNHCSYSCTQSCNLKRHIKTIHFS